MAAPVVQSTSTNTNENSTTIVVTAPSGISEGDLLLAYYISWDTSDLTHVTPSGWTKLEGLNGGTDGEFSIFYKIALVADESAANYTFTSTGAAPETNAAAILRIDGVAAGVEIQASDAVEDTTPGTSYSETVSATPLGNDTLVILGFGTVDLNVVGVVTTSGYASTPTETYTELLDFGIKDGADDGVSLAIATAEHNGDTTFTNISATHTGASRGSFGSIVIVNAPQNVTADISHLDTDPTVESLTVSQVNVSPMISHLEIEPEIQGLEATATTPTQWTNEAEVDTTWNNEQSL